LSFFETLAQCPEIKKQPINQTDCEGNSIRMLVESTGGDYQWEKKKPNDSDFKSIAGATRDSYQIYPTGGTENPNSTLYRVRINKNGCEIVSNPASITLNTIESIINPLICERSNSQLKVVIPNHIQANVRGYQWTRSINGGPFQDMTDDGIFSGTKNL
jgi:hypothetical protein